MFLSFYLLILNFMFSISNFLTFWIFMELLILIFMGLAYSTSINSFSYLINYFLLQAYSSFSILVFYLFEASVLITLAFIMNLCIFPFHNWFIPLGYRLNNFLLLIASTLHNLPAFIIILFFNLTLSSYLLELSSILSIFVSAVTMFVSDYRLLLVCSSVGNNSWFLFSSFCNTFTFFLFFLIYSVSFILSLSFLSNFSKPLIIHKQLCSFFLLSLSGLPPFPVFFIKLLIVYQLSITSPSVFIFILLLVNSIMASSYLYYVLSSLVSSFRAESNLFL